MTHIKNAFNKWLTNWRYSEPEYGNLAMLGEHPYNKGQM